MTRLGDLDARMAWMEPTTTADGVGGQTVVWAAESYLWARMDPAGGREVLTANALHPSATHRVITWRRDDVTLRWRLRDEESSQLYELLSIRLPDRTWMELDVVEVVA